jgi:hypothetical protein
MCNPKTASSKAVFFLRRHLHGSQSNFALAQQEMKMIYPQIFVRKEPTTDELSLKAGLFHRSDLVAYSDSMCSKRLARWAWFQASRPRTKNETVLVNMVRYEVTWMEPIKSRDIRLKEQGMQQLFESAVPDDQVESYPMTLLDALEKLLALQMQTWKLAGFTDGQIRASPTLKPIFDTVMAHKS